MHIIQATVTSEHVHTNVHNSPVLLHVHIYLCLLCASAVLSLFAPCVCTQFFDGILSTLPRQTSGGGKFVQEVIDEMGSGFYFTQFFMTGTFPHYSSKPHQNISKS